MNYTAPTANDDKDGSVAVSCSPASGSTFAIGTTTVTCSATDTRGNTSSSSFNVTVTDPPRSVALNYSTDASATITWAAYASASSQINYGASSSYGNASSSATLTTAHSITLTGLSASTAYHYQVRSVDDLGNIATSSDQTFTTEPTGSIGVSTIAQLAAGIAANSSGTFDLLGDYDASADGTYAGSPIPTTFIGMFDGQAFSISNLIIVDSSEASSLVGLFANIGVGGTVENLNLDSGSITVTPYGFFGQQIGALAAVNRGTIDNVTTTMSVTDSSVGAQVGGLVGLNYATRIVRNVQCNGSVSLTMYANNTYQSN